MASASVGTINCAICEEAIPDVPSDVRLRMHICVRHLGVYRPYTCLSCHYTFSDPALISAEYNVCCGNLNALNVKRPTAQERNKIYEETVDLLVQHCRMFKNGRKEEVIQLLENTLRNYELESVDRGRYFELINLHLVNDDDDVDDDDEDEDDGESGFEEDIGTSTDGEGDGASTPTRDQSEQPELVVLAEADVKADVEADVEAGQAGAMPPLTDVFQESSHSCHSPITHLPLSAKLSLNKFQCPFQQNCSLQFDQEAEFVKHVFTIHVYFPMARCNRCEYNCTLKTELDAHYVSDHPASAKFARPLRMYHETGWTDEQRDLVKNVLQKVRNVLQNHPNGTDETADFRINKVLADNNVAMYL